ncbi:MAG: hypothetical protein HY922_00190 [Elusimicrobia bacterium]|nr:hypothetical protein [Elusimicrobiota bacterium]
MDEKHKIDDCPSIKLEIKHGRKKGELYLSSLYGSYNIDLKIPCPKGKTAEFFCPHCKTGLNTIKVCELCKAPLVVFAFREGGEICICSRRGCKNHHIEFENPERELRAFYEKYSTFF